MSVIRSGRVSTIQGLLMYMYHMVGNFRKGFIFAFCHESRAIREIKAAKVLLPTCCTASESHWFQSGTTSNYLAILTPIEPVSKCAFDSYCSVQLGNRSATYKHRRTNRTVAQGQEWKQSPL